MANISPKENQRTRGLKDEQMHGISSCLTPFLHQQTDAQLFPCLKENRKFPDLY